jgi:hypothetical protein
METSWRAERHVIALRLMVFALVLQRFVIPRAQPGGSMPWYVAWKLVVYLRAGRSERRGQAIYGPTARP